MDILNHLSFINSLSTSELLEEEEESE
jgi:hypothetical protein